MRITKLHYVFSFIFILSIALSVPGYAQKKGKIQKGLATWYGTKYHGKKTTSGEVYNKNGMTAAHPSLPFGTKVKVTNSLTKKSVIVRINDRGPFGNKKRIIDLSEAAARKIKVQQAGEAQVVVEILSAVVWMEMDKNQLLAEAPAFAPEETTAETTIPFYAVQAVFSEQDKTHLQSEKGSDLAHEFAMHPKEEHFNKNTIHRLKTEQISSNAEIQEFNDRLDRKGINGFIRQMLGAS